VGTALDRWAGIGLKEEEAFNVEEIEGVDAELEGAVVVVDDGLDGESGGAKDVARTGGHVVDVVEDEFDALACGVAGEEGDGTLSVAALEVFQMVHIGSEAGAMFVNRLRSLQIFVFAALS